MRQATPPYRFALTVALGLLTLGTAPGPATAGQGACCLCLQCLAPAAADCTLPLQADCPTACALEGCSDVVVGTAQECAAQPPCPSAAAIPAPAAGPAVLAGAAAMLAAVAARGLRRRRRRPARAARGGGGEPLRRSARHLTRTLIVVAVLCASGVRSPALEAVECCRCSCVNAVLCGELVGSASACDAVCDPLLYPCANGITATVFPDPAACDVVRPCAELGRAAAAPALGPVGLGASVAALALLTRRRFAGRQTGR